MSRRAVLVKAPAAGPLGWLGWGPGPGGRALSAPVGRRSPRCEAGATGPTWGSRLGLQTFASPSQDKHGDAADPETCSQIRGWGWDGGLQERRTVFWTCDLSYNPTLLTWLNRSSPALVLICTYHVFLFVIPSQVLYHKTRLNRLSQIWQMWVHVCESVHTYSGFRAS